MAKLSYTNALNWAFLVLKKAQQDPDIARYLLIEMLGWTPTQLSLRQQSEMPEQQWQQYQHYIEIATTGQPPQYILGKAWFYGRQFQVNEHTLIPRQDSEAMIAQILRDNVHGDLLELGTGSGALVLTLALEHEYNRIVATDISTGALRVAQENVRHYQQNIVLRQGDLFAPVATEQFDVIVFNPPYISEQEKNIMDQSVLKYEPQKALFASQDGLAFYQRIFKTMEHFLKPDGKIYLEFGFQQQAKISKMFHDLATGFQAEFFRDVANNPRFMRIQRKR
ncbi:peptide chain release factor N(5)-glutamine methyltransferase [Bombilactobacillus thymidiniphilus]|uniref:peptide chain release factor N(5)-glutamine methyltransferase n=1 Tax=Bombilactobacillus thymidiniphilus TaxID=2923363 RepID=A0ABY4PE65_9LACO|nr:peptide chain release factor N(5)-glutamine methyltransferase [Bombilactobacillus thymidiniphilus]UQS83850.1 peptide chain release factor N(5)-glutamine methyltransferase [Bombilactobacillus thymidiniphilus]